ncbi:MAG: hypothetical protein IPI20_17220 [Rhodoferax sp.]|nr:hypothetical protein [Rhodoferax sp.]
MTAPDIKFLNLQGPPGLACRLLAQTVDACLALGTNGTYTAVTEGKFLTMVAPWHASLNGRGTMDNAALLQRLLRRHMCAHVQPAAWPRAPTPGR